MFLKSPILVIAPPSVSTDAIVRTIMAAAPETPVVVESDPALGIARSHERPLALFVARALLEHTLAAMGRDRWSVIVLVDHPSTDLLAQLRDDSRIVGQLSGVRPHELRYAVRRLAFPHDASPEGGLLLGWGAHRTELHRERVVDMPEVARALALTPHESNLVFRAARAMLEDVRFASSPPILTSTESALVLDTVDPTGHFRRSRFFGEIVDARRRARGRQPPEGLADALLTGDLVRAETHPDRISRLTWWHIRGGELGRTAPSLVFFYREVGPVS